MLCGAGPANQNWVMPANELHGGLPGGGMRGGAPGGAAVSEGLLSFRSLNAGFNLDDLRPPPLVRLAPMPALHLVLLV